MNEPQQLLDRLQAIGHSLAASGDGLALIGLGSVGVDLQRLDQFSDLDFFAIVAAGSKQRYLDDLTWLSRPCPIAFHFRNAADGFKLLYEDGIFCEMAVFEPDDLAAIPFAPGRIVWKADGVDDDVRLPQKRSGVQAPRDQAWLLGEALTTLYVGLLRYHRGEKLSAQRFVQVYALDHLLALHAQRTASDDRLRDPFAIERRLEQRFPALRDHLPQFSQGYAGTPQSAAAILAYLDANYRVNERLRDEIARLIADAQR